MESNVKSKLYTREQNNIHETSCAAEENLKNNYYKFPKKVQLVGIVNCTPDSFYDGGWHASAQQAIAHGKKLIDEGADWLDIGGESTKPGVMPITADEELRRVLPVVEALSPLIKVSIDTYKPAVAQQALLAGAKMLNDISGFVHPAMCELAAESHALCCVMHMQGHPVTMQLNPHYPRGVRIEIKEFFQQTITKLLGYGVLKENLILDPGIGYGKTREHNFEILAHLSDFFSLGCPLYLGMSRKSFLKTDDLKNASLSATLTCATVGAWSGACYLRVHDVKEHREVLTTLERLHQASLK